MNQSPLEQDRLVELPLISQSDVDAGSEAGQWHGWTAIDAPHPSAPQGVYRTTDEDSFVIPTPDKPPAARVELLAPAGGPEAGYAAFHFGADAIYLGLRKFSARAEAENFTFEEVDTITAYAHSLNRRVFVTINTLIREDELAELIEAVATLADIGVDALIIQDLGVYHLVRRHFPQLELHASTQLSVHNRAGVEVLRLLGFQRVVLARELTFEEVNDITATGGVETEVFIHGALCYAYSGLCLFSSQTIGRSGNRGKCSYSCRDSYEVNGAPLTLRDGTAVRRDPREGFPFSMKDLALPDHIPALQSSGVSCFKIEGRKKSPLYVATTTDYYRKLIDGKLAPEDRATHEADMQTVFSRPWTRLFVQTHTDKEVADRDTVGHRGALIGKVEAVLGEGGPAPRLRFTTDRALEKHDGLQVDLPTLGKPFGFAVEQLWQVKRGRKSKEMAREAVVRVEADTLVEVSLPRDHPPLPIGAPVYCSSSQEVKRGYRHESPNPEAHRVCKPLAIEATLTPSRLRVRARVEEVAIERSLDGPFQSARDVAGMADAARGVFDRLGGTKLELDSFTWHNDDGLFVPISKLNTLRRELVANVEDALRQEFAKRIAVVKEEVVRRSGTRRRPAHSFQWSLKVDRVEHLDALEVSDFVDVEEVIIDIARDHPTTLARNLQEWGGRLGRERIRLAIPPLTRRWEDAGIRHKIASLRRAGWTKWEAGNLSAWSYLDLDPTKSNTSELDLSTDWSVYVINRLAARELLTWGVSRFTLSPEDGLANVRSLLGEFSEQAVLIVHQDTPLFLAESCAYANLIGGCPGKANCRFESMEMQSSEGEKVTALDYHCRTIVLNQTPFCLSPRLKDLAKAGAIHLRADFIYRKYDPAAVRDHWRSIRAGRVVPGGHAANFDRGME